MSLNSKVFFAYGALACLMAAAGAGAQTAPDASASVEVPANAHAPCAGCVVIPKLTDVKVVIAVTVGSAISKSGDAFAIRLAEPIVIGGKEIVPAGTMGMGEVVHAKKSGGSGAAGELVLAARYLEVGGQRLALRSMRIAQTGESKIDTVNALNLASAAAPGLSLIGFFITGGKTVVPEGTVAGAKTAELFTVMPAVSTVGEAGSPEEGKNEVQ